MSSKFPMVDLAEQVNSRITEYVASESTTREMRNLAASMAALPLWSDIGGCIALKPDGSFLIHDSDTGKNAEENGPAWQLLALVAGSKQYPELKILLPKRTDRSEQCAMCKGGGTLVLEDHVASNLVCGKCFGLGWTDDYIVSLSEGFEIEKPDI